VGRGKYDEKEAEEVTNHAFRMIIGGSGLWMFGSILNASQVYERVDARVQFMQKMVSIPFLMSSTLFLVSGILGAGNFPYPPAVIKARVLFNSDMHFVYSNWCVKCPMNVDALLSKLKQNALIEFRSQFLVVLGLIVQILCVKNTSE
jgi:hypothetical protein